MDLTDGDRTVMACGLADEPVAVQGSTFAHCCASCGRRVMIAPSGQARMRSDPGIIIACIVCIDNLLKKNPGKYTFEDLTAEQVEELNNPVPNFWRKRN